MNALQYNYSDISSCLFAIQQQQINGDLNSYPELIKLLKIFEEGSIKKLYYVSIGVLGRINGEIEINPGVIGDFYDDDFLSIDFFNGFLSNSNNSGDFNVNDFSSFDFYTNFIDEFNDSYSGKFQSIINLFSEFVSRIDELTIAEINLIERVLINVLEDFENIQQLITQLGLNICANTGVANNFNNADDIYLQAVGSSGTNGIPLGILLRWNFSGELGDHHLPKGNTLNTENSFTGFNRSNDFISVYKTLYTPSARIYLDFEVDKPAINFKTKTWVYYSYVSLNNKPTKTKIKLSFKDELAYDQLAIAVNANTSPSVFLAQYNGVIEIELVDKYAFLFGFEFQKQPSLSNAYFKLEAFAANPELNDLDQLLSSVKATITINDNDLKNQNYLAQNIKVIRFKKTAGLDLKRFYLETYHDFINITEENQWALLKSDLGLSLNDEDVFERLENSNFPIDNLWPQYNEGTKLRVDNYKDKWNIDRTNDPSIKTTVQQYLQLSLTDPKGNTIIKLDDVENAPETQVSLLELINMTAVDYHTARMLGLGHIDYFSAVDSNTYIYKITYSNKQSLANSAVKERIYLSLPTSINDERKPISPLINQVNYQIPVNDELSESMFDENGYAKFDQLRAVNIRRQAQQSEIVDESFLDELVSIINYNKDSYSNSLLFGVEYRADSQVNYQKPEITTEQFLEDDDFKYYAYDSNFPETGVLETAPVPDNPLSLFVHFEKNNGIHHYAIYGIDWFARASLLSSEVATNETQFQPINSLNPPVDVTVQYIQNEETLLFTTQTEQDWLKGREENFEAEEFNYTRLTFNYLDITDVSFLATEDTIDFNKLSRANRIQAFFKPDLPLEVKGKIEDVLAVNDNENELLLLIGGYRLIDGTLVQPNISQDDFSKFYGNYLDTISGKFKLLEILEGSGNLLFRIEKNKEVDVIDDEVELDSFTSMKRFALPSIGDKFTLVENLVNLNNWNELEKSIQLVDFINEQNPIIETEIGEDDNNARYLIGGLTGAAVIERLVDTNLSIIPGYYSVSFENGIVLNDHPQKNLPFDVLNPLANSTLELEEPHVEWYKGLIRIATANGELKLLEVLRIVQTNPLIVYVVDPNFADAEVILSESENDFISGINFHPGYKVYLFPEKNGTSSFNKDFIFPGANQNEKKTLLALNAIDARVGGTGLSSVLSIPSVLLARKVQKLLKPAPATYALLKVRPDENSKAAFTFDTTISLIDRQPFGFSFYRLSSIDILEALYEPLTIQSILESLETLTTDTFFNQRWLELVNLVFDDLNPENFKVFDALPNPYGFPIPDKLDLHSAGASLVQKKAAYAGALNTSLLPLTEQVPVLNFIKSGLVTENKLSSLRDVDGNLLDPNDENFDPFPMIRKFQNNGQTESINIRFTDYSLSASSRYYYFYACAEVNNQLVIGPLSEYIGPVSILQTQSSLAPIIRTFSVNSNLSDYSISFDLSPFLSSDLFTKIRIHRYFDNPSTFLLSNASSYLDQEMMFDEGSITVIDDFSDLISIPSGYTIYYRLSGIRTILNEFEELEDIISLGSDVITVNLVDTFNPLAPELIYNELNNSLTWNGTVRNGKYHLYKLNSKGNWEKTASFTGNVPEEEFVYELPELIQIDEDGDTIYHRFKIGVENSSGLFSLTDYEITI